MLDTAACLVLSSSSGSTHTLIARSAPDGASLGAKSTRWHAFYDVPAGLTPGNYEAAVQQPGAAVGAESTLCTFIDADTPCLSSIEINAAKKETSWPTEVFTVRSQQPGIGRNATAGVLAALAEAKANGGGVVFFPRGQYFIDVPLIVPDKTIIRGAGQDLVSIYFAEATCPCDMVEMARLYSENQTKWSHSFVACRNGWCVCTVHQFAYLRYLAQSALR